MSFIRLRLDWPLTVETAVHAYRHGIFPMADWGGRIGWYEADPRAIIPLENAHVPRRLARTMRQQGFEIRVDTAFAQVMRECAKPRYPGDGVWISRRMVAVYTELHQAGLAHSVETWQAGELVGGLYGVSVGGLFAGESMFYRVPDASKAAFAHLLTLLRAGGFVLLDTQMVTPLTASLGAVEISRQDYHQRLAQALEVAARWPQPAGAIAGA